MDIKYRLKNSIKRNPIFNAIKKTNLYRWWTYYYFRSTRMRYNLKEAKLLFESEKPQHGVWKDYKQAWAKHLVSYSEYMYQYEFWHLNEAERSKYISRLEMRLLYERIIPKHIGKKFWDKVEFLNLFNAFIHRKWIVVKSVSYEEFRAFIEKTDCIAKPIEGSLGTGIFKISKGSSEESLYKQCVKDNLLIEECISNEQTIAQFHPKSLNTIRLTTVSGGEILGTFLRVGRRGNIVDNAHAGGIFAQINPDTGEIESDGIDTDGHQYVVHPDTGVPFKGFRIPRWEELVETCRRAHRQTPDAPVVGWDICIDSNNNIEIIEGNHLPDVDVLQSPLKIGIKAKVETMLHVKFK